MDILLRNPVVRYETCASDTPAPLRRCADAGSSPRATLIGHPPILDKMLVGFFCSVRCPGDVILKTYDLAGRLREIDVTIVGGFQSPMEKECLGLLLRGSSPVVVCPARGLGGMRIPKGWRGPLAEGRLLILSFFEDIIRRPTAHIAARRNAYVAALCDRLVVAHAQKGGKTEELCKEVIAGGKTVFIPRSPDNSHLLKIGAVSVPAQDPSPIWKQGIK